MLDAADTMPVITSGPAPVDVAATIAPTKEPPRVLTGGERRKIVERDRAALVLAFPEAFSKAGGINPKRPLKIGIDRDVIARGVIGLDGQPMSLKRIRRAIHDYTVGPRYARGLLGFDDRIDLEGEPAGQVSAQARQRAEARLQMHARAERRKRELRMLRAQRRAEAQADA